MQVRILSGRPIASSRASDNKPGNPQFKKVAERIERFPVRLTQLAHGLPVGGELDYLDEGTLAQAMRARRPVG